MGLREYSAMWRHWRKYPPIETLVPSYLGYKPPPEPGANQDAAIMQMMAMFGVTPDQLKPGASVTLQ